MERLTQRTNGVVVYVGAHNEEAGGQIPCEVDPQGVREILVRLAEYEDTGLEPAVCANYKTFEDEAISKGVTFKRIVALMEANRTGRLVVLPCKVGDTVWAILDGAKCVRKCVVEFVNIGSCVATVVFTTADRVREQYGARADAFGKTVFLAREEAEEALMGAGHDQD